MKMTIAIEEAMMMGRIRMLKVMGQMCYILLRMELSLSKGKQPELFSM